MSEVRKPPVLGTLAFEPEEMSHRARTKASVTHARHDARELTSPARAAFLTSFDKQVDPDGVLTPDECRRRAMHARKDHLTRLAHLSVLARRGACDAPA
jgi:hypothetical protein